MWQLGYAFMTGKTCLRDSLRGFFGLNRYVPILLEIPYFFIYEKWFKEFSVNAYFILKKLSITEVYIWCYEAYVIFSSTVFVFFLYGWNGLLIPSP